MLRKLLKYELFATARQFLPLYGALLVISLFNRLMIGGGSARVSSLDGMPAAIGMMVYMCLIVAIFVITLIVMIQRFHKNLLSDEGYLMFTLPVKSWQLITSKLLISIFWSAASMFVLFLSILLMIFERGWFHDMIWAFDEMMQLITSRFGMSFISFILQTCLTLFLTTVCSILIIYASIALGHLVGRHRLLAAFGAFIGLNIIQTIVSDLFGSFTGPVDSYELSMNSFSLLPELIFMLLCSAAYFAITDLVLTRKLNLD